MRHLPVVASYDLLLGYTGIVSFAHTMFFGIGAYGVAIASTRMGPGFGAVITGTLLALARLSPIAPLAKGATFTFYGRLSAVEEPKWPAKVITFEFSAVEPLP